LRQTQEENKPSVDIPMENCNTPRKKNRGKQGKVRKQVAELLRSELSPQEVCSHLNIHEQTFWYHVRQLRNQGHIFPFLSARQDRERRKTGENILADWLAIKEQARGKETIKLLRVILMTAHRRGMINFETYRNLAPHQYFEIKKYDWVTALAPDAMKLVRGLLRELERNKDWDAGALVDKMQEKEFSTIVEALKIFDMVNLKENARLATEMLAEAGEGNSMS
jgi:transposase